MYRCFRQVFIIYNKSSLDHISVPYFWHMSVVCHIWKRGGAKVHAIYGTFLDCYSSEYKWSHTTDPALAKKVQAYMVQATCLQWAETHTDSAE